MIEQTNRMVCDVLLDQDILPGVGNIIKNEVRVKIKLYMCI
jgi:formamidopyrimidine-DNA glycosylase